MKGESIITNYENKLVRANKDTHINIVRNIVTRIKELYGYFSNLFLRFPLTLMKYHEFSFFYLLFPPIFRLTKITSNHVL